MSSKNPVGTVYLVGAGPGDPGLLTLRGAQLLALADLVVYDHLADPSLLRHSPAAQKIYVGKQAAAHSFTQERINALLVEQALAGRAVVRLKGGDPFVFGRGGEECQALRAAGVPFEVVPGVTAAIAAAAYAGIPATHRDLNSSFTVVTGHEKEAPYQSPDARARPAAAGSGDIDWAVLARLPALAFYMGVKSLPRICQNLIDHGMDPSTPAATIRWGTRPRQRTVTGTIADLPQKVAAAGLGPPAVTIVGRVVSLRPTMNWFETRPLFGQRILVTRTRQQAGELSRRLTDLGAEVLEVPTIEPAPLEDTGPVDRALQQAGAFDWVIFTSQNAVSFTRDRLRALGADARLFGNAKLAAIGPGTQSAIEQQLCLKVDLCPDVFVAEALADALRGADQVRGKRHLLLRAEIARPVLAQRLAADGSAEVRDVPLYQTRAVAHLDDAASAALDAAEADWITFTSSSTARNFAALLGGDYRRKLAGIKLASIGPVTTTTLRDLGLEPTVQAEPFTIAGLVTAIHNRGKS